MSNALQDQLLKAGLTTNKKIKKQKQEKHKKATQQKKNKNNETDEITLLAQQTNQEKRKRDQELNQQKDDAAKQKAILAQIKQLIKISKIDLNRGETAFNFDDNGLIKRIYVTDKLPDQISRGKLAVAKFDDKYYVVPAVVAHKIKDRDTSYIIVLNDAPDSEEIDDVYAEYEIPDDLMW